MHFKTFSVKNAMNKSIEKAIEINTDAKERADQFQKIPFYHISGKVVQSMTVPQFKKFEKFEMEEKRFMDEIHKSCIRLEQ